MPPSQDETGGTGTGTGTSREASYDAIFPPRTCDCVKVILMLLRYYMWRDQKKGDHPIHRFDTYTLLTFSGLISVSPPLLVCSLCKFTHTTLYSYPIYLGRNKKNQERGQSLNHHFNTTSLLIGFIKSKTTQLREDQGSISCAIVHRQLQK